MLGHNNLAAFATGRGWGVGDQRLWKNGDRRRGGCQFPAVWSREISTWGRKKAGISASQIGGLRG